MPVYAHSPAFPDDRRLVCQLALKFGSDAYLVKAIMQGR